MGRNKEPVKLIQAKGKKHLTKAEIEKRSQEEVPIIAEDIRAPDFLDESQKEEFYDIAEKLKAIGIMSDLDCGVLARYIKSESDFVYYDKKVTELQSRLLNAEIDDESDLLDMLMKYEKLKGTAFNQCHTCASALGLTITSRCKIVVPQAKKEPEQNKFERFMNSG